MAKSTPSNGSWQWFLGLILMTAGIALASGLVIRLADEWLSSAFGQRAEFRLVSGLPEIELRPRLEPIAGVLPSQYAAPSAPVTPQAPPLRIEIPAIGLDSPVVPVSPISTTTRSGSIIWAWDTADYAVGHLDQSAVPGAGNVVLAGHNNTKGEVFRYLPDLSIGDIITVYTSEKAHSYRVDEITIVPYRRNPTAGEAILQTYLASTNHEQLILISCYPYVTNADRIVVVASPLPENSGHGF